MGSIQLAQSQYEPIAEKRQQVKCVDCGRDCRNRCSGCGRPYCSYCRDKSRHKTCLKFCRGPRAARAQQSLAARQTAKQQAATAQQSGAAPVYTPPPQLSQFANPAPGVQGATPPGAIPAPMAKSQARKMLFVMSEAEFKAWKDATIAALEDAQARGAAYLARRAARGMPTSTDIAMQRDQVLYADLVEALHEVETLWEWAQVEQRLQAGTQHTGIMLAPYDKLQP